MMNDEHLEGCTPSVRNNAKTKKNVETVLRKRSLTIGFLNVNGYSQTTAKDLEDAVARLVIGAFYQSGQSCIGVQRIMVHDSIYDTLRDKLVIAAKQLVAGDPKVESTFIGPMISESEAERLETWIKSAIDAGGQLLCGGQRQGAMLEATLLERVHHSWENYILSNYEDHLVEAGSKELAFIAFSESLRVSLSNIRKRLGNPRFEQLSKVLEQALAAHNSGDPETHKEWIEILLRDYYDPMYNYQLENRKERIVFRGNEAEVAGFLMTQQHDPILG